MKSLTIILLLFGLVILSGCTCTKIEDKNFCGDRSCTLTEDCNSCPQDCVCLENEYCTSEGICRKAVCGDEICTEEERLNKLCCEDCDCEEGKICNKVTQKCQEKIEVSEDIIINTVDKYLSENQLGGKIKKVVDTYYKDQIIKEVTIDCGKEELPYPCEVILFINELGEIVNEMRTT